MKTLEELQIEYNETVTTFETARKIFIAKEQEIKLAVISYAKYKAGDKVSCQLRNRKEREQGIIRSVAAKREYRDDVISVYYVVGKIITSGAMHKSQNIGYSEIVEKDVELVK